jgi:lambda family phage tail tape measure protein
MSDVIGRATIQIDAELDKFNSDMVTGAKNVKQFSDSTIQSSAKSVTALNTIGDAAADSAQRLSKAQTTAIQALQRQVAAMQGGKIAAAELKAAQLGIADSAAPLIAQWRELEVAQRNSTVATYAASASTSSLAESDADATTRIKAMVAASVEKTIALQAEASASLAAAAAARDLAASNKSGLAPTIANSGMSSMQQTANEVTEVNQLLASIGHGAGSTKAIEDQTNKLLTLWGQGRITAEQYAAGVKQIDASELSLIKSSTQAAAAADQFIAKLKDQAATTGLTSKQLLEYRAAQLGVTGAAAPLIAQIDAGSKSVHAFSLETGGAQREVGVLARELANGNFSQAASSFSVLAQRSGLMSTLMSPLALSIAAVVAGVAAVGVAAYQAEQQQSKFNDALVLTGNFSGTTSAGLDKIAQAASSTMGSILVANDAVTQLASSGKFTSDQISLISKAAVEMQATTRQAVSDTIRQFEDLAKSPVDASIKLNEQYHYLTLAIFDQIEALQKQGDTEAAAALAESAYAAGLADRARAIHDSQNVIARGWDDAWNASKRYFESVGKFFTDNSLDRQISNVQARLTLPSTTPADLTIYNAQLKDLQKQKAAQDSAAALAGSQKQIEAAAIDASHAIDVQSESLDKNIAKTAALAKLQQQFADLYKGGNGQFNPKLDGVVFGDNDQPISGGLYSKLQADIESKYKPKAAPRGNENSQNTQIKALQGQYQERERALKLSNDNIKSLYDLGLMDTQQYLDNEYAAKKAALSDEMKIADQQEDIAKQKKSGVALQEALSLQKKIRDEQLATDQKYTADSAALAKKNDDAVKAFTQSLVDSYNTRQQAINNLVSGVGLGNAERDQLLRLNQVQQEYDKAVDALNKSKAKGEENGGPSQEVYDQELAALQDNLQKRLGQETQYSADLEKVQGNGWNGATRFMQNYADNAKNTAAQVESIFSSAASGMEDAFATFVTTGKLSFTSLATSVIADIAKMQAKAAISGLFNFAITAAAAYFGSPSGPQVGGSGAGPTSYGVQPGSTYGSLGSGFFGTKNALGGIYRSPSLSEYSNSIVDRPTTFAFAKGAGLMGEAGPEAIMPLTRTANGSLGVKAAGGTDSGGIEVNVYVQSDGSSSVDAPAGFEQFGRELGDFVDARINKAAIKSTRQGGQIWKMQNAMS